MKKISGLFLFAVIVPLAFGAQNDALGAPVNAAAAPIVTRPDLTRAWIQTTDLPAPLLCHGTAYDPVEDKIYAAFGAPDGYGTYSDKLYRFDPVDSTWLTMAAGPDAVDWVDCTYADGKLYVFGGYDGGPTSTNRIYDINNDLWSLGASMPSARACGGQVSYNDSLEYYLLGYTGATNSANVYMFNPYTNSWTTATAAPQAGRMGGCAITDNIIWLIGGVNNSSQCFPNLYKGVINPANCNQITWSTAAALPVPNGLNGATQLKINGHWFLYELGGFENLTTASAACHVYDVAANVWDAISMDDYLVPITRGDFLIGREGHNELYVIGGDHGGDWYGDSTCAYLPVTNAVEEKPSHGARHFGFAAGTATHAVNSAHISFNTVESGNITLNIYDGAGRWIAKLVSGEMEPGLKSVTWRTNTIASGVYFLQLKANNSRASHRLTVVK